MTTAIHQPHDKLFKLSMGDLAVAQDFLRAYLPEELLQKIDLTTLKLEKNSFIDESYKTSEADIVYNIQLNGSTVYIYILCEQQTEVDDYMAFRLLIYMLRLMETHHRQNPMQPLPIVYPLVVYSGVKKWHAPLEIFPLFGEQEELARLWFLKPYQLLDLQRMSDKELEKQTLSGLVTFALKYRKLRSFTEFLKKILPKVQNLEQYSQGLYLGRIVLQYIVDGMEESDADLFIKEIQKLPQELKGEAMTIAEQLIQRGMQQGIQQGLQQGMQQGEAAVIIRLVQKRFGDISAMHMQMIACADTDTLLQWSERVLDACTVDEIFY